jgi:hypothetical protein
MWQNVLKSIPWVPVICGGAIAGGLAGLAWYEELSAAEKKAADAAAGQLALELFNTEYRQLSAPQARQVHEILEARIVN